jgi:hypothetical protein
MQAFLHIVKFICIGQHCKKSIPNTHVHKHKRTEHINLLAVIGVLDWPAMGAR